MEITPKTGRSILFVVGVVGSIEQEAARLIFGIPPSEVMVGVFLSFIGATVALTWAGRSREPDRGGGDA